MNKKIKINKGLIEEIAIKWALLCQTAPVDRETNMLSAINILEEVTVSKNPLGKMSENRMGENLPQKTKFESPHTLVVQLERSDRSAELKLNMDIQYLNPEGELISNMNAPFIFEVDKVRTRVIVSVPNFVFDKSGNYTYQITVKDEKNKSIVSSISTSLDVKIFN